MSRIFCSIKLSTLIGKSRLAALDENLHPNPLYDWNAQLFTIDRQKCIIITNKATLYSVVRINVIKKDLNNSVDFFIRSLLAQLKADNLEKENISVYWQKNLTDLRFCPTDNDRKVIGSMN